MSVNQNVETVDADDTLSVAIGKLKESGQKALVVVEGSDPSYAGILTERAVARTLLDPSKTKVRSVYQRVPAVNEDSPSQKVAKLMVQYDTRVVPVIRGNKVTGIINDSMLLRQAISGEYGKKKVKEIMTPVWNIVTIGEEESIGKAISLMRKHGITRLPVMKGPKVTGIVTIHDTLSKIVKPKVRMSKGEFVGEKLRFLRDPVRSIMSSPVIGLGPDATVKEAFELMEENDISSVVVVNDMGELVGLVTRHDLLKPLAEEQKLQAGMGVQLTVKIPGGTDEVDVKHIQAELESFLKRYEEKLSGSNLSVYIKGHRERKKGRRLIHVRLVLNGPSGSYSAVDEGWGDVQAVNKALKALERQLSKRKGVERRRTEGHKNVYEVFDLLY
ncbi:MAG: CBS domain-containing protein [Conexivisphaerales archaeon]